ncbi:hypothetical protein DSO57_1004584 [Entomophthora muscae]|uniref:Uncharacterized protein n=1 Tax=Entomophthora muscae TaxID=34485 RepID=A0ACC2RZB7_9FUNG|nr:hypothetical protein DSO57_1004584 [Entomophthora muscae]
MSNFNKSLVSNCPVRKFNCNACTFKATYSNVHLFEDKLVDAVTVVLTNNKQKKFFVSYWATITAQNWLDNFNGMLVDLPTVPDGVKVHHGICLNYLESYHHVRKTFKKLLNNPHFKGYSCHSRFHNARYCLSK